MDSLNNRKQGKKRTLFSRHKFDRAEPDGSIIIPGSNAPVTGTRNEEPLERRRMIRNIGIISAVVAVVLIVGIIWAFVAAPRKEEVEEIDREEVAKWIDENQSEDIYELEKIFTDIYAGKHSIFQMRMYNDITLSEQYAPALEKLKKLQETLVDYAEKSNDSSLSEHILSAADFIKKRYDAYVEALELIDYFYDMIVLEGQEEIQAASIEALKNYDKDEVQTIFKKVQQELTQAEIAKTKLEQQGCLQEEDIISAACENLQGKYIEIMRKYLNSAQLLNDILDAVTSPIDYEHESYILYNLDALSINLENSDIEATDVLNPLWQNTTMNTEGEIEDE